MSKIEIERWIAKVTEHSYPDVRGEGLFLLGEALKKEREAGRNSVAMAEQAESRSLDHRFKEMRRTAIRHLRGSRVARARGMKEAARVLRDRAEPYQRMVGGGGIVAELHRSADVVDALAGQPPPDTAPRERSPQLWEAEAHDGLWLVGRVFILQWRGDLKWWGLVAGPPCSDEQIKLADIHALATEWRPVTHELESAAWPERESDDELQQ